MTEQDVTRPEIRLALWCLLAYITIYALEAPIRYGLSFIKLDELILFRDLLILVPLGNIALRQLMERRLHLALPLFAFLLVMQGAIFYFNVHAFGPIVLGAKIFANMALGLVIGEYVIGANRKMVRYLAIVFLVSCAGLVIEKFVTRFPWVGMTTIIGGVEVDISHDWMVNDDLARRVGGFTRESICAASLVPFLGLMLRPHCHTLLRRIIVVVLTIGCVFLTTQKGALIAIVLIGPCLMLPTMLRLISLRVLVLVGAVLQVLAPFVTSGMLMAEGSGGVFSSSSMAARVIYTWPQGLAYLAERSVGPFGVGIGGLGGPLRLVQTLDLSTFGDNMFLFLFAYFGIFAAIFYVAVAIAVWRSLSVPSRLAEPALALAAFCLIYGVVITAFEDQVLSLTIGVSLGTLLNIKNVQPIRALRAHARRPLSAAT